MKRIHKMWQLCSFHTKNQWWNWIYLWLFLLFFTKMKWFEIYIKYNQILSHDLWYKRWTYFIHKANTRQTKDGSLVYRFLIFNVFFLEKTSNWLINFTQKVIFLSIFKKNNNNNTKTGKWIDFTFINYHK
jgi:hypothetical protein